MLGETLFMPTAWKNCYKTWSQNQCYGILHKDSVFSNLNTKFPFQIEGKEYNSPEQFFHYCMAIHFNDTESARKIMSTLDPFKQLEFGKSVSNYNHTSWKKKAKPVLFKANRAKYEQNDEARKVLFGTGNAFLAEASPN